MTPGGAGAVTRVRAFAVTCAGIAAVAGASGCSGVHLSHPGRTAACAQALPAAFSTVRSRGRLVGFRVVRHRGDVRTLFVALGGGPSPGFRPRPGPVATTRPGSRQSPVRRRQVRRRIQGRRLERPPPQVLPLGPPPPGPPAAAPARAVCLAVFQGSYSARDVAGAPPGDRGRYAVLIIFIRHAAVVRTRLVDTLPRPVRHLL